MSLACIWMPFGGANGRTRRSSEMAEVSQLKIVSWNIGRRADAWRQLVESDADVALLQEACAPPADVASKVDVDDAPWCIAGPGREKNGRAVVVGLSDRVSLDRIKAVPIAEATSGDIAVSRLGTLAAAVVTAPGCQPLTVVSVYAAWETAYRESGNGWIYADASAHRLISDMSILLTTQGNHRLIVAGDWNIFHGYGDKGSSYWAGRYASVFDRMAALGLEFVGPQAAEGGLSPIDALPAGSRNVATRHPPGQTPASAVHQLDFAFASTALAKALTVRALNTADEWGPSDHCRITISMENRA